MAGQKDKFGITIWHNRKAGGFIWEQEDSPKNSKFCDFSTEFSFPSSGIIRMKPNGPTDFGVGKNISTFKDSIGGCGMDFPETAARGFAFKKDDVRDMIFRALIKPSSISSGNGFSISCCTGHHSSDGCCQGFAYMITTEITKNPSTFRFRKEMWHVSYHNSPEGEFTDPLCNFKINGVNHYVGIGLVRYNKPGTDNTVVLELWFNPDADANIDDWHMIKKITDRPGNKWGNDGNKCGGDKDQVGTWSNAQNRMKTNSSSGQIDFKCCSLIEIDPGSSGSPDPNDPGSGGGSNPPPAPPPTPEPIPPPTTGTTAVDWIIRYNLGVFEQNSCGSGVATPGLNKFYDVTDNGSSSSLHRDRYRACMVANSSSSKFIGRVPRRVVARLSSTGSPPAGDITCVLRKGSDDSVAVTFTYTGGPNLDAATLTDTKTSYTFENLTSTYVWGQGDRICIEYSSNTSDTANDVNVFRNTDNPYDGTASCAVKFDGGGPPPTGYTAADTGRDYAWEIWDGTDVPAP